MNFSNCPLYGMQKKSDLYAHLHLDARIAKQQYIESTMQPRLIEKNGKQRLVECSYNPSLLRAQKQILVDLQKLNYPDYLFSGVKGKSYIDNARRHHNCNYLFKLDIQAFFPSIRRECVYRFFHDDLRCSPDVSSILSDLTTINLDNYSKDSIFEIKAFLSSKDVNTYNHLLTGASPSIILSYLANRKMFDELYSLSIKYDIIFSVYVDDIFFSSKNKIPSWFINKTIKIITGYGYHISKHKKKYYTKTDSKEVTGVIITPNHRLTIKHKHHYKIASKLRVIRKENDYSAIPSLLVSINAAQQIDGDLFSSLNTYIKTISNTSIHQKSKLSPFKSLKCNF